MLQLRGSRFGVTAMLVPYNGSLKSVNHAEKETSVERETKPN